MTRGTSIVLRVGVSTIFARERYPCGVASYESIVGGQRYSALIRSFLGSDSILCSTWLLSEGFLWKEEGDGVLRLFFRIIVWNKADSCCCGLGLKFCWLWVMILGSSTYIYMAVKSAFTDYVLGELCYLFIGLLYANSSFTVRSGG